MCVVRGVVLVGLGRIESVLVVSMRDRYSRYAIMKEKEGYEHYMKLAQVIIQASQDRTQR
jgi:hypothetical protein